MKAIFVVPLTHVTINPVQRIDAKMPANADLHFTKNGEVCGGYSLLGQVPNTVTCLVLVEASAQKMDELANNNDYLFIEETPDEETV